MTDLTNPQSVLERPTRPSTGAAPRPSETEPPLRWLGWLAALAAVAALAIVGAIALSGGEEVDQIEASTPSPGLVTTDISTLNGYWNPYTLEWVPFQTTSTTSAANGYWNPYTLEWVPFED
jgi:hypothetical protein